MGGSGGGSGGDVEVRVRTTARGTSVSVLLPSAAANAGETGGTAVVGSCLRVLSWLTFCLGRQGSATNSSIHLS